MTCSARQYGGVLTRLAPTERILRGTLSSPARSASTSSGTVLHASLSCWLMTNPACELAFTCTHGYGATLWMGTTGIAHESAAAGAVTREAAARAGEDTAET